MRVDERALRSLVEVAGRPKTARSLERPEGIRVDGLRVVRSIDRAEAEVVERLVSALRVRVPRLLDQLAIARADRSYGATQRRLAKLDVLVLDDLLIAPMKDTERRDLLEVLEDRYDQRSTVVTNQVPTKTWHEMLADPTVADAICDRLVQNAHVLSLKGPSIRKKKTLGGGAGEKSPDDKR